MGQAPRSMHRGWPMRAALAALVTATIVWAACGDDPVLPLTAGAAEAPTTGAARSAGAEPVRERPTTIPTAVPTPTATPVPPPLTLVAVGDMMLARSVGWRISNEGPEVAFEDDMREVLRGGDITVGNLETAVSERGTPQPKGYTFQAPPATLEALRLAGFDVVSLANNHALDYGFEALADTRSLVTSHGIEAVGAGDDIAEALAPKVLVRSGVRVAFVGLADVPEEGAGFSRRTWGATAERPGIAWADQESVTAAVTNAAAVANIVVVMLHFGIEYATAPSPRQRELARAAIDAGAAVVIGSHPHVLQEVEEYGGGLIAYSLGNFVFDGFEGTANDTGVLVVTLRAGGVEGWELIPARVGGDGFPRLAR